MTVGICGVFSDVADGVADEPGADHDLDRGHAPLAVGAHDEALGDDALDHGGELVADLVLLVRREGRDDPVDGLGRVQRVQRGQDEVARLRRVQRDLHRLGVAHLTDEDDVGVLAERGAQRGGEARRVLADLALADHALVVLVDELDGVLDGDDVVVAVPVHEVDHGGERRRLARARDAGDQDQARAAPCRGARAPSAGAIPRRPGCAAGTCRNTPRTSPWDRNMFTRKRPRPGKR